MDKLLVNSRLTRRSLLQRTSIGAALAATNLSLPFKAVANEKSDILINRKSAGKSGLECLHSELW